jgi:outer membrane protein
MFTPAQEAAIRSENDRYPFSFNKNPWQYSIGFSLPLFDGFRREQQIQQAELDRSDARYRLKGQELQITTDVTSAYRNLVTALQLAEERYRVGSNTFVDVSQARADFENAATQSINAIYDYHKAFAELERSVGRPLR